jgi:DNA-binding transcriptional LysR family regulator
LSESFETLRAAVAGGAIAAVLPARVAARGGDLLEITPEGNEKDSGLHQIFVVSPSNCDRGEADFLAYECTRLLGK